MFKKIKYKDLNSRAKENYNFQKVSSRLADYGITTMRLSDDYNGADFIGIFGKSGEMLKVQLKSRFTLCSKYRKKGLHICFPRNPEEIEGEWYLLPYDELEDLFIDSIKGTKSFVNMNEYSWSNGGLSARKQELLEKYKI